MGLNRMPMKRGRTDVGAIAREILDVWGTGHHLAPFSDRYDGFDVADAYRVAAEVHRRRETDGYTTIGRKIGFTNRHIWREPPMWGFMYDRTVHDLGHNAGVVPLTGFAEPRIEPEIVFGLAAAPTPAMDERALVGCIEWVAHGFEVVQSIFPGWRFTVADAIAAGGLHGELLIGTRHPLNGSTRGWERALAAFEIELFRNDRLAERGHAKNVLDGPVLALAHLVGMLASDPLHRPLAPGDIVSTGTLTNALPIVVDDEWSTAFTGIALDGLRVRFAAGLDPHQGRGPVP